MSTNFLSSLHSFHVIVYYLLSYLYDRLKCGKPLDRNVIQLEATRKR